MTGPPEPRPPEPLASALEQALGELGEGVVVCSRDRIVAVNDAFCEIVGRPRAQLIGLSSVADTAAPDERGRIRELLRRHEAGEEMPGSFATRLQHADGHPIDVALAAKAARAPGGDPLLVLVARDVTQTMRRDASLLLLAEASGALVSSTGEEPSLALLLRLAVRDLADAATAILLVDGRPGPALVEARDPSLRAILEGTLAAYPPDLRAEAGMGRVLRTGRTELALSTPDRIGSIAREQAHADLLASMRLRSVLNVALPGPDGPLGVVGLLRVEGGRPFDTEDARLAEELARRTAEAIERGRLFAAEAEARADAERVRWRLSYAADVSRILAAAQSPAEAAAALARYVVPDLGDWCAVDVVDEEGSLRRLGAAHRDPALVDLLFELDRRYPVLRHEGHLRSQVMRTGQPLTFGDLDERAVRALSRTDEQARMLIQLGMRSALWLPLVSHGATFGILSFGVGDQRAPYGPEDLRLAEELAARCGEELDRGRTLQALRRRERQQAGVADLGRVALEGAGLAELGQLAAEMLGTTLDVPFVEVLEATPGQDALRLVAGIGWRPGAVGSAHVESGPQSQAGYTLASGAAVIVSDLARETRFTGSPLLHEHAVASGVSVAIRGRGGRLYGALGAHDTRRRSFTPDDVHVLDAVANVLAGATERREAEDALRASEQRLELALAASQTGTWDWDIQGGFLRWSPNLAEIHGLPPDADPPTADGYRTLIHPADVQAWEAAMSRAAVDGRYDLEFRLLWPDGSVHWLAARGMILYDDDRRPVRMVGTARDVTDRRVAEEERDRLLARERQAAALRETFIGVLSHELRTPITTIFAGAKLLARDDRRLPSRTGRGLARDIEAEADRLYRLVEDLLVLTKAERGNVERATGPMVLGPVLRRVASVEQARSSDRSIRLRIEPGLPAVRAEDTYVEQVMRNLLGNAAKYAPPGSIVQVVARAAGDEVHVRVLDRGRGIEGEDTDRLFEPFYRAPAASDVPGAGIGLFVTRELVAAMGGRVWARPRPGGGAEFGFALRAYESSGQAADAS
jgi:PAS domain S-box-containing protein